jgi:hypothetical protein
MTFHRCHKASGGKSLEWQRQPLTNFLVVCDSRDTIKFGRLDFEILGTLGMTISDAWNLVGKACTFDFTLAPSLYCGKSVVGS